MAAVIQMPTLANIDQLLNSDIANDIAKTVHAMHMSELAPQIHAVSRNPLERALDKPNPLKHLKDMYDAEVYIDAYVYWSTIVVHLPKTNRFFMWHHYADSPHEQDLILVDGFVEDGALKMERCMYKNLYTKECFNNINDHNQKYNGNMNNIPFSFLSNTVLNKEEDLPIDFTYDSGRTWENPDRVCAWFEALYAHIQA